MTRTTRESCKALLLVAVAAIPVSATVTLVCVSAALGLWMADAAAQMCGVE